MNYLRCFFKIENVYVLYRLKKYVVNVDKIMEIVCLYVFFCRSLLPCWIPNGYYSLASNFKYLGPFTLGIQCRAQRKGVALTT